MATTERPRGQRNVVFREELTPVSFLERAGTVHAGRIAVVDGERRFTYREWRERARRLASALRASGHGSIVLVGSTAGQRGEQGHSHYAASKGALQSLAMSLAVELAPRIRTNVVSPGWIRTPMAEAALRTIGPLVASTLPNRRLGEIDDVVNAVLYLSSDASSHLLGENLSVSGGALLVVPRGQLQPR